MIADFKTCGFCFRKYDAWDAHAASSPRCAVQREADRALLVEAAGFTTITGSCPKAVSPVVTMGVKDEPALRYDGGKSRVDLIDPGFILRLGEHYGVGAKKYAARNWQKGMSFSRCYSSAQRHMLAFWSGEDHDEETGSRHVIAAAWNMAAIDFYMSDPALREKFDDRPKGLNS